MKNYVTYGIVAIVLSAAVILGLMYLNYSNAEIRLRQQIEAQQDSNEAVFDNTWKIIKQQAQVTDKYKDSFKEIYVEIMDERYEGDRAGALMSWVTESNPEFDTSLFSQLMTSIEAQRNKFTTEQRKLIDYKRSHDTMLKVAPSSWFVGKRGEIEINIVTSAYTDEVFAAGEENNIELFGEE